MFFESNIIVTELSVFKTTTKPGKPLHVSARPFNSLSLRLDGEVTFEVDGKKYTSRENGITFMPAGIDYVTQVQSESTMLVVHFETKDSYPKSQPLLLENCSDVKGAFSELCDKRFLNQDNKYRQFSLFYAILDAFNRSQKSVPRRMRNAKLIIDSRFSENLRISSLAMEAGISEVHFRSEFKEYFGLSPLAYLKRVRIQNAKQLLRSGYYSVTDTALMCGFESISYFSYEFKRLTGVAPSEYVNNL